MKLKTRIKTAGIIIAVLLLLLYFNVFFINYLLIGGIFALAFIESLRLYSLNDENNHLLYLALAFYLPLFFFPNQNALNMTLAYCMLMITFIASYLAYIRANSLEILKPFFYPIIPIFVILGFYKEFGISYLLWLILIVALTDSGAYFVGKKFGHIEIFGRTQFSQTSPNKTIVGLIGGFSCSVIFSSVYALIFLQLSFTAILFTTILTSILSIFGDLFESYLKRKVNLKDSGNLLPGHGGVLDRLDGYLFACFGMMLVNLW